MPRALSVCVYLSTVEKANNIHIGTSNTLFNCLLYAFGYIDFRLSNQSGLTELVGEYKNADWVTLLDGRVICV